MITAADVIRIVTCTGDEDILFLLPLTGGLVRFIKIFKVSYAGENLIIAFGRDL